ncbi:hypothetical protein [Streptomyces sp. NPDC059788]|uniref:hypothetical protein n=1 Tax=Streptomyces sp. NPDC059788 TaxID=3346948 RepID=UPI0036648694
MRLGKALAVGVAEDVERPERAAVPETAVRTALPEEEAAVDGVPEPEQVPVPAGR